MVYTECAPKQQQFHMAPDSAVSTPLCAVSTPLWWILKEWIQSLIQNHVKHELGESAREQRIVLYKSDQFKKKNLFQVKLTLREADIFGYISISL